MWEGPLRAVMAMDAQSRSAPLAQEGSGKRTSFSPEFRLVLLYVVLASVWIVWSDHLLDHWVDNHAESVMLQTFKGLNFVVTTAALLYVALARRYDRWRRAEQKWQESEDRFALAARAATDAIWDWNLSDDRLWWSDSFYQLFGYSREEVEPTIVSWTRRLHPEDKERTEAGIYRVIRGKESTWSDEYRFRRKDGSYAVVYDRGFVLRDAAGHATRMVGGMSDITGRRQAEERVENSHRQLRALSAHVQSLREEERSRIAREIHDQLGQMLTALKMDLQWIEKRLSQEPPPPLNPILDKVVEAVELADTTLASVQRISAELRPPILDSLGLAAALRQESQRFQARTGIQVRLSVPDTAPVMDAESATAVFRIFQEALTNVARHAGATRLEVSLVDGGEEWVLTVADNGRGIRSSDLESPRALGLLGMRERAAAVGGEILFEPGLHGGTVVTMRLRRAPAAAGTRGVAVGLGQGEGI